MSPHERITASTNAGTMSANEYVKVFFNSVRTLVGTPRANGQGVASLTFTVPTNAKPGKQLITMTGETSHNTVTVPVTVAAAPAATSRAAASKGLPLTGANDTIALVGAGAVLVLVGAGTLLVVRRRRTQSAS